MIDGKWLARYSARQHKVFVNEDGRPDEIGQVTLKDGQVTGSDPWGGEYKGTYSIDGNKIRATVRVESPFEDHPFIFESVPNPFVVELSGEFNSLDYFSMTGPVVGSPEHVLVVNCSRDKRTNV